MITGAAMVAATCALVLATNTFGKKTPPGELHESVNQSSLKS
jgi:hypothetical protein